MRFAPISYSAACYPVPQRVTGYALQMDGIPQWLHLCVRKWGCEWLVDHYESGFSLPINTARTREAAAYEAVDAYMNLQVLGGGMANALQAIGYGWCVPKGT